MVINLSLKEANMLLDAANRMEADDVWDEYDESLSSALASAQVKLGQAIGYQERKAEERKTRKSKAN